MREQDFPSDSDASDDDYRPSEESDGAASEEESGPEADVEDLEEASEKLHAKKRKQKGNVINKARKRKKKSLSDEKIEYDIGVGKGKAPEEEIKQSKPEEVKKKADSLWADFLKDVGDIKSKPAEEHKSSCGFSKSTENCDIKKSYSTVETNGKEKTEGKENKLTTSVKEIFEFAGEKICIEKQISSTSNVATSNNNSNTLGDRSSAPRTVTSGNLERGKGRGGRGAGLGGGSSALTSFLGQLGKKNQLSTLEKSKLDWDQFKQKEGIEEDIRLHNKGKDGFLEKQDFLQRTDLRRFEIEKELRKKQGGR